MTNEQAASEMFNQMTPTLTGIRADVWHAEIVLAGVRPVSLAGDTLTLKARDERNLQALELWAKKHLERTASFLAGRPIQVAFTLNGHTPEPEPEPEPETQQPTIASLPEVRLIELNHEAAGWARHSHYLARFLRAYIGAAAFDVWDFIRSHCKDGSLIWTPARDFTGRALARGAACSYQRVVGVWRSCIEFDQAYFRDGELIPCCQQHPGAEMAMTKPTDQFPQGRPTCRHWVPGALETLEIEGLAAWRKHGDTPRSTFYSIQVYQKPPILTPAQAARLDSVARIEHRDFLAGLLSSHNLTLSDWETVEAYSVLAIIDQAEWLAGLTLEAPKAAFTCDARNHIFFESASCAKKGKGTPDTPGCTQTPPDTMQSDGL